jgi:2-polyprenyl-6-methoxyphenol hydroxylase-like FAD-dependent oxidoreductase
MTDHVLIVGAGPVGLTMALELARYRVPVRIVDRMPVRERTSRAVAVWCRTLELLDRSGVTPDLLPLGNRVSAANILAGGRLLTRIDLSGIASPYPFALMVPQYDTEAVLERHLGALGVRAELGTEIVDFHHDADGVTAVLRAADGREETERVPWLVACDGAHSVVRHRLGLAFAGDTIGLDWSQGDFRLTGSPFPTSELATYWHEDGVLVFFPMGPDRFRVIASTGASTDSAPVALTREAFQEVVDRRGPGGITLTEAIWTSAFRINERQVASYREGRVFLAGDAAHVHSPAGGQGMNTGMQDVVNLAWKLAMNWRGISRAPELLASYDAERRPVGAQVIQAAGRLTRVAAVHDHTLQHVRNVVAHLLLGLAPIERSMAELMTEVSIGYPTSPLNGSSARGGEAVGTRMCPLPGETPYGGGDRPRFTLRGAGEGATRLASHFAGLVDPKTRAEHEGAGIQLVRPDGYLAASAPSGQWDKISTYLERFAAPVAAR